MDIEGYECKALKGGLELLNRSIRKGFIILSEWNVELLKYNNFTDECIQLYYDLGFTHAYMEDGKV